MGRALSFRKPATMKRENDHQPFSIKWGEKEKVYESKVPFSDLRNIISPTSNYENGNILATETQVKYFFKT